MNRLKSPFGKQLLVIAALAMLVSSVVWLSACRPTAPAPAPTPAPAPAPAPTPAPLPGSPVTPPPTGPVTINLTAVNMAFDKFDLVVHAGEGVTIVFENKDSGVPHNFAAYEDNTAAKAIFVGEVITGPKTITYQFTAPAEPGAYFFRCDTHPAKMTGALIVQGTTT